MPALLDLSAPCLESGVVMTEAERWLWVRRLYQAHRERVTRFLVRLAGDPAAAEDLTSETFIRAFEAAGKFAGRSQETTWLFGIALNVARNHRAKERRRRILRRLFLQQDGEAPSAANAVEARQRIGALDRAMNALSGPLREAYVVRVLEERPLKEAAALLGVPVSTLSERAARAEALVRASVEKEGV